jgi:Fe-S-cluster-containing hydrogenase component 2
MCSGLEKKGFLSKSEIDNCLGCPSEERLKEGPVAFIECTQEIPCNPCEAACPLNAIQVGEPITNLPVLDEKKCKGCGLCIAYCPGLAIFLVDYTYSDNEALISFPHEYLPLPKINDQVEAVNREGKVIARGTVIKVNNREKNDRTSIISITIPKKWALEVRGMERLKKNK